MALDLKRWLAEFPVREHGLYLDHAAGKGDLPPWLTRPYVITTSR